MVEEPCCATDGYSPQIRLNSNDMIVNFRVTRVYTVQDWSLDMTGTNILEFSMDSQI